MIIERTENEIIFRISASTDIDELQDLADFLEFKEIAKKSKVSQKGVDQLVKTIKKGRWKDSKNKLNL